MGFEWAITFLVLACYRDTCARRRMWVSLLAACLAGTSLALTVYALLMPLPPALSLLGVPVLIAVLRCRGNVAKIFSPTCRIRHNDPRSTS